MTAPKERRSFVRLPREQRMREIEAAARECFARHGFDAAPINEIASLAGISEGSIYNFYNTKRDLLHTILETWYQAMIDDFRAGLESVTGARERLHIVIRQHLVSIHESPDLCRLFYSEVRNAPDYHTTRLYQMNREYTRVVTEIVSAGIGSGELRPDTSVALVRDVVFGGVEHRVSGFLAGRADLDCDRLAAQITSLVFDGVARRVDDAGPLGTLVERLESAVEKLERRGES